MKIVRRSQKEVGWPKAQICALICLICLTCAFPNFSVIGFLVIGFFYLILVMSGIMHCTRKNRRREPPRATACCAPRAA